jgi:hypothetical protein
MAAASYFCLRWAMRSAALAGVVDSFGFAVMVLSLQ